MYFILVLWVIYTYTSNLQAIDVFFSINYPPVKNNFIGVQNILQIIDVDFVKFNFINLIIEFNFWLEFICLIKQIHLIDYLTHQIK